MQQQMVPSQVVFSVHLKTRQTLPCTLAHCAHKAARPSSRLETECRQATAVEHSPDQQYNEKKTCVACALQMHKKMD